MYYCPDYPHLIPPSFIRDPYHLYEGPLTQLRMGIQKTGIDALAANYVTILHQRESRERFNADSIIMIDFPIPKHHAYKGIYTHGMAMFIHRFDRAYVKTVWFFTDKGNKNRDKYLALFHKTIWYRKESPSSNLVQQGWSDWTDLLRGSW